MQKFFRLISILALSGLVLPVAHSCCPQSSCSAPGNIIYHQTMTPLWLEAHASYIDRTRTQSAKQITFNGGSVINAALLKVPMIPAGVIKVSTPLTVEITVANDVNIGKSVDSDMRYGVSDGVNFVGFQTWDKANYGGFAPCHGMEGASGAAVSKVRYDGLNLKTGASTYPGQFVFTLKLDERWGSCFTAHNGGFVRTANYNNRLTLSQGLTLEVYKSDRAERVGIKFIKVSITQDGA